ncbi:MAG: sortase [Lachnospiraceae bacterium]|nr:sortase [Lachnospiraceae bacterium]
MVTPEPTDTPAPTTIVPEETEEPAVTATPEPTSTPEPTPVAVPNPYTESFLANSDMAGWLLVPGTNIDYPIMWTPEDENYYLYRAFDKSDNVNGSLILDTDSSLNPLTTNLIIHGHNMKSGAMFGNLTDYESKDYYEDHKQIILYTEECQRNYEIIAVFRSQVYKKSDDVFKFYKFFQADTQEEFDDFYQNIKELSAYDTGVTAQFGDRFITLSTCVYHVTNGRFVVVAKEIEPGETYLPIER